MCVGHQSRNKKKTADLVVDNHWQYREEYDAFFTLELTQDEWVKNDLPSEPASFALLVYELEVNTEACKL